MWGAAEMDGGEWVRGEREREGERGRIKVEGGNGEVITGRRGEEKMVRGGC